MYNIGIDIGGTKINIGLFSEEKSLLGTKKLIISEISDFTAEIIKEISDLCHENDASLGNIGFVGIGIPGTVSKDGKHILKAPNIKILSDEKIAELSDKLKAPVRLVQDSRAAAWGEYICGAGVGKNTVVCVTLGTGIGTGIVSDGKIYNGALGNAGELGHIPVTENGRACGCGKNGCLEKYCAGLGLSMTAKEILGVSDSNELFKACESGNEKAKKAIDDAVVMLGRAMVSIVNLISPDCLLFSGGLSNQEELYLNPLISYIKEHAYASGKLPEIKKAKLAELAPLYGAGLLKNPAQKREPIYSASVMCADFLHLDDALLEIEKSGIKYIHADIMDNHFVPNLMLPPEFYSKIRKNCGLAFDYHIMAENPETVIERLDIRNGDIVSVHIESTNHLQRVISLIKEKGASPCAAINPSTPIELLSEIIYELDTVLIMTVNPGFSGQKIVENAFSKIKRMREFLDKKKLSDVKIEVDGNCSFENVPKMYENGADIFVVGTSSVFKTGQTISEGVEKLNKLIKG